MSGTLVQPGILQFLDGNGDPLVSGSVTLYVPNTLTLASVWGDAGETVRVNNPVPLDAAGRPQNGLSETSLYTSNTTQMVVKDVNGVQQWSALSAPLGAGTITGPINQAATGQFYQQNGAVIDRLNDRVFVGNATVNSGNATGVGAQDWLQLIVPDTTSTAQFASLAQIGNIAVLGATQSLTAPPAILDNFAIGAFGINNNTSGQQNVVTSIYNETRHYSGAFQTLAHESDLVVLAGSPNGYLDPYNMFGNLVTANLWLTCGRPDVGSANGTVGIALENNAGAAALTSGAYTKGIVFDANAILGTTRSSVGASCAIAFAAGHEIQWFGNTVSGAVVTAGISCSAVLANAVSLAFTDSSGANFTQGLGGPQLLQIAPVAGAVNWVEIVAGATGAPVTVQANGSDANIDLIIAGHGSGRIRFGTAAVAAGSPGAFSANNYIPVKDASGSVFYVPFASAPW